MGAKRNSLFQYSVKDNSQKGDIEVTSTSSSQVRIDTVDCNERYHLREKKNTGDMGWASFQDST